MSRLSASLPPTFITLLQQCLLLLIFHQAGCTSSCMLLLSHPLSTYRLLICTLFSHPCLSVNFRIQYLLHNPFLKKLLLDLKHGSPEALLLSITVCFRSFYFLVCDPPEGSAFRTSSGDLCHVHVVISATICITHSSLSAEKWMLTISRAGLLQELELTSCLMKDSWGHLVTETELVV